MMPDTAKTILLATVLFIGWCFLAFYLIGRALDIEAEAHEQIIQEHKAAQVYISPADQLIIDWREQQ